MNTKINFDTICAIATPAGQSALGIIRISGKKAVQIIDKLFFAKSKRKIKSAKSHTIHYGIIKDKKKIIDEVLVLFMKADKSYTGLDTIEISSHGNPLILKKILTLLVKQGIRLAEPGEFTKQAFLNARFNLFQAESICDIISAKTETALDASLRQLQGSGTLEIENIICELNRLLMFFEAEIDFSEEDISFLSNKQTVKTIKQNISKIKKILDAYEMSDILRNGLNIVIAGAPNTGKSSLLNALIKKSKAIVTDIPGTTRDSLECMVNIKGIPCNIIDTAGIREAENFIEKEGIRKTKEHISQSHIVIFLLDASRAITKNEKKAFNEIQKLENFNQKVIIIGINKIDIKKDVAVKKINAFLNKSVRNSNLIELSSKQCINIDLLEKEIIKTVNHGKTNITQDYMANARHKHLLGKALEHLLIISGKNIDANHEIFAFELKQGLDCLEEVIGRKFAANTLDMIFSSFCIGK